MSDFPVVKVWVWVNRRPVFDGSMTAEEVSRVPDTVYGMCKMADTWVVIIEDLTGKEPPGQANRNDNEFAQSMMRQLFPGRKLPEGEMSWQQLHGVRYHEAPPDVWDGIR